MKWIDQLLKLQKRYALWIVIFGLLFTALSVPRAVKLLTRISTDLVSLLPDSYPSVHVHDEIGEKFKSRNNLFLLISSNSPEKNLEAAKAAKIYLESLPEVHSVVLEKPGYDFFDKNKFMIAGLDDLYAVRDQLRDEIQKKKLGGLYIDFETVNGEKKYESFEDLVQSYKKRFSENKIASRYNTNESRTVYILSLFPTNNDSGLGFSKKFAEFIEKKVKDFDLKRFGQEISWGYSGAIQTRVDEYNALLHDLKRAGLFSTVAIFLFIFLYYRHVAPVILIFIPVVYSTILNFAFCSFFFDRLNVVTSFLFTIILGLGVDIGIHMMTRYIQDRRQGIDLDTVHKDLIIKIGKSSLICVLTTVATFYVLIFTDFRGFSEFGWIAGTGLLVSFVANIFFLPALVMLSERYRLMRIPVAPRSFEKGRWFGSDIPRAKALFWILIVINLAALFVTKGLQFEWDFNKLKMILPERQQMREYVKEVQSGRINSPAAYLISNPAEAKAIRRILEKRKSSDPETTIDYVRSYYDLFPDDQKERFAALKEIDTLLSDKLIKGLSQENQDLVSDLRKDIARTKRVAETDIPENVRSLFWGSEGDQGQSLVYVAPLPHLVMDDGKNAVKFSEEVGKVEALGKTFYAVNNAVILADVINILFRDSKIAVILSFFVLLVLIWFSFPNARQTAFIFLGLGSGILFMLTFMTIFDLKLSFYNMIIIPAVMGMGIDNSVHVVHRYDEIKRTSVLAVLRTTGGASFTSSFTTMLGYAGLCFTHHPGLSSLGWMAIIGMASCLLGSLVVLPVLLQLFLPKN